MSEDPTRATDPQTADPRMADPQKAAPQATGPASVRYLGSRRFIIETAILGAIALAGLIAGPTIMYDYHAWQGILFVALVAVAWGIGWIDQKRFDRHGGKATAIIVIITALVSLAIAELHNSGNLLFLFYYHDTFRMGIFVLNLLFIFLMMALLTLLSGRWRYGAFATAVIVYAFSLTDCIVIFMRSTPFIPADLTSIQTAVSVTKAGMSLTFPGITLICAGLLLIIGRLALHIPRPHEKPLIHLGARDGGKGTAGSAKVTMLARIVAFLIAGALTCLGCWAFFTRSDLPQAVFGFERFSYAPLEESRFDGFIADFLDRTCQLGDRMPQDYSPEAAENVVEDTVAAGSDTTDANAAASSTSATATSSQVKPNIIFIQDESLADYASIMPNGTYNQDTLPFIHSLIASGDVSSGTLSTSVLGGMTVITEWEVLTGSSSAFITDEVPYQNLVTSGSNSLASTLSAQGYTCVANHPCNGGDYRRSTAFSDFGFDSFITLDDYDAATDSFGKWVGDEAVFDKSLDLIKNTDEPLFLFDITMQNHTPFVATTVEGATGDAATVHCLERDDTTYSNYLTLAHESDRALSEFIGKLATSDEPTIVVFYGDHEPPIGAPTLEWLSGVTAGQAADASTWLEQFQTPVIIWNNFGLASKDIGRISPNYLGSYVLDYAGLDMTDYERYLLALREQMPAITAKAYWDADGNCHAWISQGVTADGTLSSAIDGYRIVQYNAILDGPGKVDPLFYLSETTG